MKYSSNISADLPPPCGTWGTREGPAFDTWEPREGPAFDSWGPREGPAFDSWGALTQGAATKSISIIFSHTQPYFNHLPGGAPSILLILELDGPATSSKLPETISVTLASTFNIVSLFLTLVSTFYIVS